MPKLRIQNGSPQPKGWHHGGSVHFYIQAMLNTRLIYYTVLYNLQIMSQHCALLHLVRRLLFSQYFHTQKCNATHTLLINYKAFNDLS